MSHFDFQRKDSAEELLAGWMSELESVLYSSEVEEAIKEVASTGVFLARTWPEVPSPPRWLTLRVLN